MAGYMVARITVTDPDLFAKYGAGVPATIAKFGGRYLVRGGDMEAAEGDVDDRRTVILEFESIARAKEWYNSDDYADLKAMRQKASDGQIMFVDGYEPT